MRVPTIRVELIGGPHDGLIVDMEEKAGLNLIERKQAKRSNAKSHDQVIEEKDEKMRNERLSNKSMLQDIRGTYKPLRTKADAERAKKGQNKKRAQKG